MTECGANDGGYYVGFYEKTDHDNGLGGFLFMLEVFPTDYDYTELPEYQAICGLTVDGANYNLIAELPTDVQFANENRTIREITAGYPQKYYQAAEKPRNSAGITTNCAAEKW